MMKHLACCATLALCMISAAQAQPGGPRGFRGFGGGGGFGLGGLIGMPEVQKELGLSEADAAKLTDSLRELRPQRGEGDGGNFRDLSPEERDQRMAEFRKQMEETGKKIDDKVKSSLTEAQWKRLNELRLQRDGANALERADVAEKLKLTTEQKEKIKSLAEAGRPQFGQRGGGGSNPPGERPNFEEMRARREKTITEILAVLTPEQKLAFDNLKGAKFNFPERPAGGGRGGNRNQRPAAE
jgi:Spy/CpxP family protein refolding chaperone